MTLLCIRSIRNGTTVLAAVSLAVSLVLATPAIAAPLDADAARISSQYEAWAGGKANAESIVSGLRSGSNITLISTSADHTRNLAGFKPMRTLSTEEIAQALAEAKRRLAELGIRQPSADQIQAALIGGEVALPDGRTRALQGSVPDAASIANR